MKWLLIDHDECFLEGAGECLEFCDDQVTPCPATAVARRWFAKESFDGVIADGKSGSLLSDIRSGAVSSPGMDKDRLVLVLSERQGLGHVRGLFHVDRELGPEEFAQRVYEEIEAGTGAAAWWRAVRDDDVERLRKCLEADPELIRFRQSEGCTALHLARTVELAGLLVALGANPEARNSDGQTPLDMAIAEEEPELIEFFRSITAGPG